MSKWNDWVSIKDLPVDTLILIQENKETPTNKHYHLGSVGKNNLAVFGGRVHFDFKIKRWKVVEFLKD